MAEKISIVGLVGPSGVGKGYSKDSIKSAFPDSFNEPVVITTRPKRSTDGKDRLAGIPVAEFFAMRDSGYVLFAHQPFGNNSDWYGFSRASLEQTTKPLLTEVHIDNVIPFKNMFGKSVHLIAIIAETDYLEQNIRKRASETEGVIQSRLETAIVEIEKIKSYKEQGLIDHMVVANMENKSKLGKMITDLTFQIINK